MLTLVDDRWANLTHAYGSASDIPELLKALALSPGKTERYDSEPWESLWSSLCHQGHVYVASYAALPHIVEIACLASGPVDFSFFQLPASIEVARHGGKGPVVPPDLVQAYDAGLARLVECVAIHRKHPWDQSMLLSAIAALAVAKGHQRVAEAIINLDDDLITRLIELDFDV